MLKGYISLCNLTYFLFHYNHGLNYHINVAERKRSLEAMSYAVSPLHQWEQNSPELNSVSPAVPFELMQAPSDQQIRSNVNCTPEKRKARRDRERTRRQSLTFEERERINARRRERR